MRFRFRDYFYPEKIWQYRRLMKNSPSWSHEQLLDWVRSRRSAVLKHAYAFVPYYRDLLDRHGIRPEKANIDEVWKCVPTLSKDSLRFHRDSLISAGKWGRGLWVTTSGSTGMRTEVLLDANVRAAAFALFWRAWESGGYWKLGRRQVSLKGLSNQSGWCYNKSIRTLELSSLSLDERKAKLYHRLIRRYRPHFLRGYPSSMYLFCRLLSQAKQGLHIPMIVSGSETLHDYQRKKIEGFFGGRLYNHYTHWERAASILECDEGRLHAQEDFGHHEILDDAGQPTPHGVCGEIVVTSLYNLAMPLIRYRTGDIGAWSEVSCRCGKPFPVVDRIVGRKNDYIVLPGGTLVPGSAAAWGADYPYVLYYQLVQLEVGRVNLRLVRTPIYKHPEHTNRLVQDLHKRLGNGVKIDVHFCEIDELERSPVGKIRECVNLIPEAQLKNVDIYLPWSVYRDYESKFENTD